MKSKVYMHVQVWNEHIQKEKVEKMFISIPLKK